MENQIIGTIIDCNPGSYTVDVQTLNGEMHSSVGILNLYGAPYTQDLTWLNNLRGSLGVLVFVENQYFLLGTIPQQITGEDEDRDIVVPQEDKTEGGDNTKTYGKEVYRNFSNKRIRDFLPSDKILRGSDGTEVSLLQGGLAKLKASSMAQLIFGKLKDFGRLVARRFEFFSDFGEVKVFHNDDGKVGIELKGGADFVDETHPSQERWTVLCRIGHNEDDSADRLFIKVNDTSESQSVTLAMDTEGNIDINAGGNQSEIITGDRESIVTGDLTDMSKNRSETSLGARNVTVTGASKVIANGITMDGAAGGGALGGAITTLSICPYTGSPHVDGSSTVLLSK